MIIEGEIAAARRSDQKALLFLGIDESSMRADHRGVSSMIQVQEH
ncbi:hypothetical protein [Alkalicoccus chagannorensis]|nr:hypothetical protein [Alkalicoccus chagannorensis]